MPLSWPPRRSTPAELADRARRMVVLGAQRGLDDAEILGVVHAAHHPTSTMTLDDVARIRAEVRPE